MIVEAFVLSRPLSLPFCNVSLVNLFMTSDIRHISLASFWDLQTFLMNYFRNFLNKDMTMRLDEKNSASSAKPSSAPLSLLFPCHYFDGPPSVTQNDISDRSFKSGLFHCHTFCIIIQTSHMASCNKPDQGWISNIG